MRVVFCCYNDSKLLTSTSRFKKKKQRCITLHHDHKCAEIHSSCHRLLYKRHFYLQAATLLIKRKHLSPCWPCSISTQTVIIQAHRLYVSLSLSTSSHLCFPFLFLLFFFPLLALPHSDFLSSSSLITLSDEPQPMNRSQGVRRQHRPTDVASAMSPAVRRVDENKDLHILMNKTPWHLGRGLGERKDSGGGGSENGEKEGLGSFSINLVGIP